MPLNPIGDMATPSLSLSGSLIWETASDWDNAVSESGVVHEAFGDLPGAGTIQLGYPSYSLATAPLGAYWPLYEDTIGDGDPVDEVSSNNYDGTVKNNPTGNATGLHNVGTYEFTGDGSLNSPSDGWLEFDTAENNVLMDASEDWTFACWFTVQSTPSTEYRIFTVAEGGTVGSGDSTVGDVVSAKVSSNTLSFSPDPQVSSSVTINYDTTLYSAVFVNDATNDVRKLHVNGTKDSATGLGSRGSAARFGLSVRHYQEDLQLDGRIFYPRLWDGVLSDAEAQAYHDAGTGGSLETATKSFGSSVKPDLSDLVYSLNSQSITVDVIGSPGTASEEVVSQSLGGASSYSLTWSNAHADFRVRPNLSTTDETVSPTISAIGLTP